MNILLFGASGMVGQGVLRECLLDPRVERVAIVVRRPTGRRDSKLEEIILDDLFAIETLASRLAGYDACLYCVGVTAFGLSEPAYTRLTYDMTMAVATCLVRLNPRMTFIYVTGAGTDASERGRLMWARVKGRTENALRSLPFRAAYMLRPGIIQPLHGIRSKTGWYRVIYAAMAPLTPVLVRALPGWVTTTERLGRAMVALAIEGYPKPVLEMADLGRLG